MPSKYEIAEIAKVSQEITTRFHVAAMHPKCKDAVYAEVVAFKDSYGRRELDFDDFTYSENWMQLTADESIDLEHQILQIIAKEYPEYE
jgi:hypothetical protein